MKMLIVDDDISTIEMISELYDWSEIGITEILRAYNGLAAKAVIETHKPEIVLCDIGMPLMNGIEVLKWIYEHEIDTVLIFLTSHEDFEYARDAVRYGALNYLTKPFSPEDLLATISSGVNAVRKKSETQSGQSYALGTFLKTLCDGSTAASREHVEAMIKYRGIALTVDDEYYLVYTAINTNAITLENCDMVNLQFIFRHLAFEAITETLSADWCIDRSSGSYFSVAVFVLKRGLDEQQLTRRCVLLHTLCREILGCEPVTLVSDPFPIYLAPDVFPQVEKRLHGIRFHDGRIAYYRDTENAASADYHFDRNCAIETLQQKNKNAFLLQVGTLANSVGRSDRNGDIIMHGLHQDLLQAFYSFLYLNNVQAHRIMKDETVRAANDSAEQSVMDMIKFASFMFDHAIKAADEAREPKGIIDKVKRYIEDNFREDIGRDDIAEHIFITPSYLSKIFSKETGSTLRDYINAHRLQETRKLMLTTDKSINAIAFDTGFENTSYFSTVFKKVYGVSPSEWRNGELSKGNE